PQCGPRWQHGMAVSGGVTLMAVSLLYLRPGDPGEGRFGGEGAVGEEDLARTRRELGLDRPFGEQYLRFLGGLLRGDLGMSLVQRQPVARLIAGRLPATIELTAAAILVSLVIAIPARSEERRVGKECRSRGWG